MIMYDAKIYATMFIIIWFMPTTFNKKIYGDDHYKSKDHLSLDRDVLDPLRKIFMEDDFEKYVNEFADSLASTQLFGKIISSNLLLNENVQNLDRKIVSERMLSTLKHVGFRSNIYYVQDILNDDKAYVSLPPIDGNVKYPLIINYDTGIKSNQFSKIFFDDSKKFYSMKDGRLCLPYKYYIQEIIDQCIVNDCIVNLEAPHRKFYKNKFEKDPMYIKAYEEVYKRRMKIFIQSSVMERYKQEYDQIIKLSIEPDLLYIRNSMKMNATNRRHFLFLLKKDLKTFFEHETQFKKVIDWFNELNLISPKILRTDFDEGKKLGPNVAQVEDDYGDITMDLVTIDKPFRRYMPDVNQERYEYQELIDLAAISIINSNWNYMKCRIIVSLWYSLYNKFQTIQSFPRNNDLSLDVDYFNKLSPKKSRSSLNAGYGGEIVYGGDRNNQHKKGEQKSILVNHMVKKGIPIILVISIVSYIYFKKVEQTNIINPTSAPNIEFTNSPTPTSSRNTYTFVWIVIVLVIAFAAYKLYRMKKKPITNGKNDLSPHSNKSPMSKKKTFTNHSVTSYVQDKFHEVGTIVSSNIKLLTQGVKIKTVTSRSPVSTTSTGNISKPSKTSKTNNNDALRKKKEKLSKHKKFDDQNRYKGTSLKEDDQSITGTLTLDPNFKYEKKKKDKQQKKKSPKKEHQSSNNFLSTETN